MEEKKNVVPENAQVQEQEEQSSFDFLALYTTLVLNWKWFLVSLVICIGCALVYLRYATPVYQSQTKLLIKDDNNGRRGGGNSLQNMTYLGMMSNSAGIDNEMEILSSHSIAERAVKILKLYTTYYSIGKVKDNLLYKNQPVNVDMDDKYLDKLVYPIKLELEQIPSGGYHITGEYFAVYKDEVVEGPISIDETLKVLPAKISTKVGILRFEKNSAYVENPKRKITVSKAVVESPKVLAERYVKRLSVSQTSKMTTIAQLVLNDELPERGRDYLNKLIDCYNLQANEDKNEIAVRTEEFINSRLEKINTELGSTEGALESYKRNNNMVELKLNATQSVANQDQFSQKLVEANTQVALLNELNATLHEPGNKYQPLPSNVGLKDESTTALIQKYNEIVLERNRLLRSASETSPTVTPLTAQLDDLLLSIQKAMSQARRNMQLQRDAVASEFRRYSGAVGASPEQERMLTQIGRQQEVKSGLYLMLLQKREENSISLAATADKGKMIDAPETIGKISPKNAMILLVALILAFGIPALILIVMQFFKYRIEGHQDVVRLTRLPILGDIPVSSDTIKTRGDVVVHENKNNLMEEVFRSMRTNLQFMLHEGQKVIIFTSTTSGEGKTFTAANLAVSFSLLGKKVVLVGLDIRKPRLAELFEIDDHHHGITNILVKEEPTKEMIDAQILRSGVHDNLDLLMAGPIPPNPAELLARESLDKVVHLLKDMYDYVLIDTAPIGLVTDTLQISRVGDATVYMCRADYTAKESFGLINSLHNEKKMPNMCIAINGIDMSKRKYGYYYGYGKYAKYGKYARYGNGKYGSYGSYGQYGTYGSYGSYGNYSNSHYGNKNDSSIKR
uniref:non-specific protein-tyrosine kinase n=2 Tax=unclassified Prevotella TaxID=2638335 RepID=A0AB33ILT2_9BACT